ncbi:hypothetical protein POM88_038565 [Heracleum sosnowskyi]|uniref:Uncharacterized protein n=1 Tax=Heracleum sosnowskyi TaxID=360622 RepID=A0AAD8M7Y0_9APIA|nr:hypothetical protein POM88_038565 [Heracleum sosnowskyi]
MVPVEISLTSPRVEDYEPETNGEGLRLALDLIDGVRDEANAKIFQHQKRASFYYNLRVKERFFRQGDLVLRKIEASGVGQKGKLAPNWEGPYHDKLQIIAKNRGRMTEVENDWEVEVPSTWDQSRSKRPDRGRRLEVEKDLKIEVETFDLTPVEVEIQTEFQALDAYIRTLILQSELRFGHSSIRHLLRFGHSSIRHVLDTAPCVIYYVLDTAPYVTFWTQLHTSQRLEGATSHKAPLELRFRLHPRIRTYKSLRPWCAPAAIAPRATPRTTSFA